MDTDAAHEPTGAGRLLTPVPLDGTETIEAGAKLASWLFAAENPPRYVLILNGGVVVLADRAVWGEGRYLAVSLDTAYGRNEARELDLVAALFGADSLRPPPEGGTEELATLVAGSRQHAVGVSSELREGLRVSVELIANEVLDRIRQAGYQPQEVMELDELAKELSRESLRYLYRVLFLLYAEARPELGVLPVNDPEYLRAATAWPGSAIWSPAGWPRGPPRAGSTCTTRWTCSSAWSTTATGRAAAGRMPEQAERGGGAALRAAPLEAFLPGGDPADRPADPAAGQRPGRPGRPEARHPAAQRHPVPGAAPAHAHQGRQEAERGGFISYAQLGINQLGAVYEGLMSYTGFVATEQLYEVAKGGDPKDGSWMIPASKADEYDGRGLRRQGRPGHRRPSAGSTTARGSSSTGSPAATGRPAPPTTRPSR